jgi:opacity protein-like surface antigen
MKKLARSLAVLIFVISISVFPFNTASAQVGGYVGIFGGYTLSPDASWQDNDFNADVDVQSTGVFGVKFGYTFPAINYFSLELEYSYLNPDVDRTVLATAGSDYAAIEGDVKFHNFMFNVITKYPNGKIHPYLGAGVGVSYVDVSVTSTSRIGGVNYSERRSSDDTLFAWQILVGVDIDLINNLSVDIGYRYFATEPQDDYYYGYYYNHDPYYYNGPTLDYKTSMVTLGFKYRF